MSGEEDEKELELKDLVEQTLEANGILSKIKAQLRASVFAALDENDRNMNNVFENHIVKKHMDTKEGRMAFAVVREFLENCNLDFTLSVYDPELNINVMMLDRREKLAKQIGLDESELNENRDKPVLVEMIRKLQSSTTANGHGHENHSVKANGEIPTSLVTSIRSKFDSVDFNKKGFITFDKLNSLFLDLFPSFSPTIIEYYLTDELNNSKLNESKIDFKDFMMLYKKWYVGCQKAMASSETNGRHADPNEDDSDADRFGRPDTFGLKTSRVPANANTRDHLESFLNNTKATNGSMNYSNNSSSNGTNGFGHNNNNNHANMMNDDDNSRTDEVTVDHSISTIHGANDVDYIEDVSI